ncbi:MAG: HigA family addiction module antitoxin [Crocosphaera sp.]|nr:HigA family addiction module antitoxin [Crocosphaera sp.]
MTSVTSASYDIKWEKLPKDFILPDDPVDNIHQPALAAALTDSLNDIGVSYQRVNELINNKRGITPSTALRLGKYFGTSPDFWLNLQRANDLYAVLKKEQNEIDKIKPLSLSKRKIT